MARKDTLVQDIAVVGARRTQARKEAEDAMEQIRRLARAARKAGATKTAIAEAAQISRVTLDELLRDTGR